MTRRIALAGASGRMGRLVCEVVAGLDGFEVTVPLGSGDDLARVAEADLVVDVTLPQVSPKVVAAGVQAGLPVLVGTSGWSAERIAALRPTVPADGPGVLVVPNFSIGAVLAGAFAEQAAAWYDSIEIVEAHHAGKADSPSGTAVATAERINTARNELGPVVAPHTDQRARGQQVGSVPVHSLRVSGVLARQDVLFGGAGELLTLRHETLSPAAYVAGIRLALQALDRIQGVVVGLEHLLLPAVRRPRPPAPVADAPEGQAGLVAGP
ncbi:MAG TPA: 4-hydroxy-tetrahydrodipicolinate reductase [Amnibacterium sp.]|uniref:4-hydroxy-tetrahydrodipicolinate reductase n=1 Tax=Amnibacterium sp. TaxID=1872496 RepID=UPI002F93BC2A